MKRLATLLLLATSACGYGAVSVEGSFGNTTFAPVGTVFAVIDAFQEVRTASGALRVEKREQALCTLFFCATAIDPDVDFANMSGSEILELRETVRRGDRLRVQHLVLDNIVAGAHLESNSERNDFSFVALHGTEPVAADDNYAGEQALGRVLSATVVVETTDLREGGQLGAELALSRDRANDQPANTATGTITLRFNAPIVGERIGESNLRILGY